MSIKIDTLIEQVKDTATREVLKEIAKEFDRVKSTTRS